MSRVFQLDESLKYYIYTKPCDMRKSFNSLQGLIQKEYGRYISSNEVYIFIGKSRTTAKLIRREANGINLYVRKLNIGTFKMPEYDEKLCEYVLDYDQLTLFALGEKWEQKKLKKSC